MTFAEFTEFSETLVNPKVVWLPETPQLVTDIFSEVAATIKFSVQNLVR